MRPIKKILCPVDFLKHSELVAEYAASFAAAFGSEVEILYVSPILTDIGGHQDMDLTQLQVAAKDLLTSSSVTMDNFVKTYCGGIQASGKTVMGNPAEEIIKRIKETKPDLVIMGTQGRTGLGNLFFGSVAAKVVRLSPAPVLTLREDGDEHSTE